MQDNGRKMPLFGVVCALLLCVSQWVNSMEKITEAQATAESSALTPTQLRIATFNVSMEATNYQTDQNEEASLALLEDALASGSHPQIRNIAEIIQRVRPDILLLNEFDYIPQQAKGIDQFKKRYLAVPQHSGLQPVDYPYAYIAPVNTGEPSPFDLSGDGKATGKGADAWGFGFYPGQYGMVVLSRYPIAADQVRSFQKFKWADMPGALKPVDPETGQSWYSAEAWPELRLSSKSLWDLPITVAGQTLHVLASHPTPPVFDGPEDRNGRRNHDEIRLLADYLSQAGYIYDDNGSKAPFSGQRFVILGDLNASVYSKDTLPGTLDQLFDHSAINASFTPTSKGAHQNAPGVAGAAEHTAAWKSRADYVLPSKQGWRIVDGGVFWPTQGSAEYRLVASRKASSDHRLVYLDLQITD
ncbi:endonuclease/exonuclease/phosphatase family protein [Halioxenophilus aromaticivorans]|uniref:Endonuclease/exonuclease/phosphatase family protein n=1 Tax=Halioxenophilus aromaticivorans TaxID=1306992 RepID=A0AAV3U1T9_9ALTE